MYLSHTVNYSFIHPYMPKNINYLCTYGPSSFPSFSHLTLTHCYETKYKMKLKIFNHCCPSYFWLEVIMDNVAS